MINQKIKSLYFIIVLAFIKCTSDSQKYQEKDFAFSKSKKYYQNEFTISDH